MEEEIWKPVVDFEGLYEASSIGRVRSVPHVVPCRGNGTRLSPSRILSQYEHDHDYWSVCLCKNNKKRTFAVHRVVYEAFHGRYPKDTHQINHINRDRGDNRAGNLECVTSIKNTRHLVVHAHRHLKLTDQDVVDIRTMLKLNVPQRLIARAYCVDPSHISDISRGKRRTNMSLLGQ